MKIIDNIKTRYRTYKESQYRKSHINGHDCNHCRLRITNNGYMWRPVRSMIFYCEYDIPERAGKIRYDMSSIRNL